MKIEGMKVIIDREAVFRMIDCKEDSPVYDEMVESFEKLLPEVRRRAKGSCIFGFGELEERDATPSYPAGTKILYVISTLGKSLSALETELFNQGDYVGGMLADAMADACLFGLEEEWQEAVRCFCGEHGWGIKKRLEAPYDLPMTVQETAFKALNAKEELGIEISSGYMLDPVKSSCQVMVLSEDSKLFQSQHDCTNCPQKNCKARKSMSVKITVCSDKGNREISCMEGESILSAYRRQDGNISAVCGGKGLCGKCKIRLISGDLNITESDRRVFSEDELQSGYRLSCMAHPYADCVIELHFLEESDFQVVDEFSSNQEDMIRKTETESSRETKESKSLGIAVDIGTTTMAAQLVDLKKKTILSSSACINHQRSFGADVISRIEAANQGNGKELQRLVRTDISNLITTLLDQTAVSADEIKCVMIAGNTTMGHLLMGYPCETLGVFPFAPVNIKTICDSYENVIGFDGSGIYCNVILLPGISTFVGGDIVSGLYACGFGESEEINLLVDLGTNGEMAIGNQKELLVTSTAAGPAFEGGNISCGTGSIPGAICHIHVDSEHQVNYETIGNQPPVGICGTGVIEVTAELLQQELIDETGLLDEDYFDDGFPVAKTLDGEELAFTQKDVREIQLAKSAVRAGVETLMKRYGVSCTDIAHVYLAGGFGFKMDTNAAVKVGLFPEELEEKIIAVGNSSLAGATRALCDDECEEQLKQLVEISTEAALSTDPDFNEFYMTYMMFGEE